MSTFRLSLCFTLAVATLSVSDALAQQSLLRRRSVRQSERVARASWQPTRSHLDRRAAEQEPARPAGRVPARRPLRTVDHTEVEGLPAPPPDTVSVVDPPIQPEPLDGQISLAPVIEGPVIEGPVIEGAVVGGPVACDALPAECGCGDPLCLGCDAGCGPIGSCDGFCGGTCCDPCCGELCSPHAWRPCITLCWPQDGWISLELLGWYQDGMTLPPLVTTSTDPNVDEDDAGVLGEPSTRILYGGGDVLENRTFGGGRLRFGVWLDRCHTWGVGAEFFELDRESSGFAATSTGNPILARPFFNTLSGVEDSGVIAYPGSLSGTVGAIARSEFSGAGFYFRRLRRCAEGCSRWLFCGCPEHFCSRTEGLFGYRYLELEERVLIAENSVSTDPDNPGAIEIFDRFDTRNQFNGIDLGLMYRRTRGYWTFDTLLKLAIGNTRQTVTITGQSTINDPNEVPQIQTFPQGFLAGSSNIGYYRRDEFAVVPEFNLNVGYQLTDHFRLMLGYTGIYWSNVVRPGQHISLDLNPALFPPPLPNIGAQRPAFAWNSTDYWVQGINFGGEYRW